MSCTAIGEPVAGPSLVIWRGAKGERRWRAQLGTARYKLRDNGVRVRLVISDSTGLNAEIVATLDSANPDEILIDATPNDDYFTTYFAPALFDSLPLGSYLYAIWAYDADDEPWPLTLPATLTISESIGPPPI